MSTACWTAFDLTFHCVAINHYHLFIHHHQDLTALCTLFLSHAPLVPFWCTNYCNDCCDATDTCTWKQVLCSAKPKKKVMIIFTYASLADISWSFSLYITYIQSPWLASGFIFKKLYLLTLSFSYFCFSLRAVAARR